MTTDEFDLTGIERDVAHIVRLPNGRLLEIEWLDGERNSVRVVGFQSQAHYDADEQYRLAGYDPLLRCFQGDVEMAD